MVPGRRLLQPHECHRQVLVHAVTLPEAQAQRILRLAALDPDFYRIGHARHVRAYGVAFKEGPRGVGVYAARSTTVREKPRVVMEVPGELMVTVSEERPWMFYPDFLPLGHPLFDVIEATDATDGRDLRLACMLLLALEQEGGFWADYGDFLPPPDDCTSLLLATEARRPLGPRAELVELQDRELGSRVRDTQHRAREFWEKHWGGGDTVSKLQRLAPSVERFLWAVALVQSRAMSMRMQIGARMQRTHFLAPYIDMLNHSSQPTCSLRWRKKDRMLEVALMPGQDIHAGAELTIDYGPSACNAKLMERYGFSLSCNPWATMSLPDSPKIHQESFNSAFSIAGLPDEYYLSSAGAEEPDLFVDGNLFAAARNLPTWLDGDMPPLPSLERASAAELAYACKRLLDSFPTSLEEDEALLQGVSKVHSLRWRAALCYRMDHKRLLKKVVLALELYKDRILY
eukprot:SM000022S07232  [mRNA]  locus=s22:650020:664623:- [translate_table: standard]